MTKLASHWLHDQSLAFASALLSGNPHSIATPLAETCTDLIQDKLFEDVLSLSDTTLSLIASLGEADSDTEYLRNEGLKSLAERTDVVARARIVAAKEPQLRESVTTKKASLSRVLVSHAVYVLKQRHLSAGKFFKWLHRSASAATPG